MILTKSGSPFIAVTSGLRTTYRKRTHLIQCIKNVISYKVNKVRNLRNISQISSGPDMLLYLIKHIYRYQNCLSRIKVKTF